MEGGRDPLRLHRGGVDARFLKSASVAEWSDLRLPGMAGLGTLGDDSRSLGGHEMANAAQPDHHAESKES